MDAIVSGAVSGATGVLATIIITKLLAIKDFVSVSSTRRSVISGVWIGKIHQTGIKDDEEPVNKIEVKLKICWKSVTGKAVYTRKGQEKTFKLDGGFSNGELLQLNYKNVRGEVVQHGALILQLSGDARTLNGQYLGYGPIERKLVSGTIETTKSSL